MDSRIEVSSEACLAVKCIDQYFITQTKGGEIKVWEDENGSWRLKNTLSFEYWGFCKFDTFSKYLVCPQPESCVKIVSIDDNSTRTLCKTYKEKCGEIMVLKCFAIGDVQYIFVLYESGMLTLIEVNGKVVSDLKITSDCPMALDFDGVSRGVVGTSGEEIVGFELTSELQLEKWKSTTIKNPGVSSIVIRPDRKLVAAGCWDSRIRLFSMKSLRLLVVLTTHRETVQDITYSPSRVDAWNVEWMLAAAGKDGRITLWNLY